MFEDLLDDPALDDPALDDPALDDPALDDPALGLVAWPVSLAEVVAGPAGLELAAVLASVGDPAGLDDADLVEALAGWEKLAAHVAASQAVVLAELAPAPVR